MNRLDTAAGVAWRLLIVLAAVVLAIWGLARLKTIFIPVVLALFLASLATPPAIWLRRKGLPRLLSAWVVFLGGLLTVGSLLWFIVSEVIATFDELVESVEEGWDAFQEWVANGPFGIGAEQAQDLLDRFLDLIGGRGGEVASRLLAGVGTATEVVTGFILTLVVAFFLVKDGDRFWLWLLSKLPTGGRQQAQIAGSTAWSTLRRYLAGTAVVGLVDAIGIGIVLVVLGVPLALPLILLVFLGGFFPFVGAFVSGFVAAFVTLATNGVADAAIVAVTTLAVQQFEGNVVEPIVMGQAVRLHPLIVILAIAIGFVVAGLVGAFVAIPAVAVSTQIVRELRPRWLETDRDLAGVPAEVEELADPPD